VICDDGARSGRGVARRADIDRTYAEPTRAGGAIQSEAGRVRETTCYR